MLPTTPRYPPPNIFGPCSDNCALFVSAIAYYIPHKWVTMAVTFTYKKIMKKLAYVSIVGFVLETQCTSVTKEDTELDWAHRTKNVDGCVQFCLQGCVSLLLVTRRLGNPWKRATNKE